LGIADLVDKSGYLPDRIRIDPSVVRGLEYYTGPVYEVELTFPIEGEDGKPVRFGSVAGAGGTMGSSRASAANRCQRPLLHRRVAADGGAAHLGKLDTKPEPARSW